MDGWFMVHEFKWLYGHVCFYYCYYLKHFLRRILGKLWRMKYFYGIICMIAVGQTNFLALAAQNIYLWSLYDHKQNYVGDLNEFDDF